MQIMYKNSTFIKYAKTFNFVCKKLTSMADSFIAGICMIIPCFNEEDRFRSGEFVSYLENRDKRCFLFVDDGSRDATPVILDRLKDRFPDQVRVIALPGNRGKAAAVREGMLSAIEWKDFDLLGYMDADLSTPIREIDRFAELLENKEEVIMVLGSRSLGGTRITGRSFLYRAGGASFAWLASLFLGIRFHDTQCGFKVFRPEAAKAVFASPFVSKWIFDVEVLARMIQRYGRVECRRAILEYLLKEWSQRGGSKIPLYRKITSFFMLIRIFTGKTIHH